MQCFLAASNLLPVEIPLVTTLYLETFSPALIISDRPSLLHKVRNLRILLLFPFVTAMAWTNTSSG